MSASPSIAQPRQPPCRTSRRRAKRSTVPSSSHAVSIPPDGTLLPARRRFRPNTLANDRAGATSSRALWGSTLRRATKLRIRSLSFLPKRPIPILSVGGFWMRCHRVTPGSFQGVAIRLCASTNGNLHGWFHEASGRAGALDPPARLAVGLGPRATLPSCLGCTPLWWVPRSGHAPGFGCIYLDASGEKLVRLATKPAFVLKSSVRVPCVVVRSNLSSGSRAPCLPTVAPRTLAIRFVPQFSNSVTGDEIPADLQPVGPTARSARSDHPNNPITSATRPATAEISRSRALRRT